MYQIGIGLNRRPRLTDQVEFRIPVGASDPGRQVGVERLVVDLDPALGRIEMLIGRRNYAYYFTDDPVLGQIKAGATQRAQLSPA